MRTIILRPTGDHGPNEWGMSFYGENAHYKFVDDPIGEEDGERLTSGKNASYLEEVFDMGNFSNVRFLDLIKYYIYSAQTTFDCSFYQYPITLNIYCDGVWKTGQTIIPNCANYGMSLGFTWQDKEWTSLNGNQTDVTNLLINVIGPTGQGILDDIRLESIYIEAEIEIHNHKDINRHINRGINMAVN